jgi:hypothetical protein
MKLAIVILVVFAILIFLKFCEGSPLRSWKAVFLNGIPVVFLVCYYLNHAFPNPALHQSPAQRIAANRAELKRNFSHIAGVKAAAIASNKISLDFAEDQSLDVFRKDAEAVAGTAAHYLDFSGTNQIFVQINVNERHRYTFTYQPTVGIVDETSF